MATLPKSTIPRPGHASRSQSATGDYSSKQICLIVGIFCLAGFSVNMLTLGIPVSLFSLDWRVNVLQQVGDYSIVLLFSFALLLYANSNHRRWMRPISLVSMVIGVAFMLSCVLVIRDSLVLRSQAIATIGNQAQQLQSQIDENRDNPELPAEITPDQLRQASVQIASQEESLKQNAKQDITKAGFASMGNLIAVGLGLAALGRLGLRTSRGYG